MAEHAIYILTRNGQTESYRDPWGGVFLFRELIWGPEAFETWARQLTKANLGDDSFHAGAVIDFDTKSLRWHADYDVFRSRRSQLAHDQILANAWEEFDVTPYTVTSWLTFVGTTENDPQLFEPAMQIDDVVIVPTRLNADPSNESTPSLETRLTWITLRESTDSFRHVLASHLTDDVLMADSEALDKLSSIPTCPPPAERQVSEGITIDVAQRTINVWGGRHLHERFQQFSQSTPSWTLTWEDDGYSSHCQGVGESGVEMSDAELVASFLPYLLCANRFDLESYLEAMSSRTLGRLRRITGLMALFLGLPLVGLGLVNGNWVPAIILVLCLTLAWKLAQRQARHFIRRQQIEASRFDASAVSAGPTQVPQRRSILGNTLAKAGLPWNAQVETCMESDPWMKLIQQENRAAACGNPQTPAI
jgi:hypothetical protein